MFLPTFQVSIPNRSPQPSKKSKTGTEVVDASHTIASLSANLDTLQIRRTRLDAHSEQLRAKAGIRSALESNQVVNDETRSSDHLLTLQFMQLIDEYQDLLKHLLPPKDPFRISFKTFRRDADDFKPRCRKLKRRVQDLEEKDGGTSEDDRLRLILALGQLTKASEDLASKVMGCLRILLSAPSLLSQSPGLHYTLIPIS